ncbi:hypothetical protein MNBD_ALPHA11-1289 [hydrothermal vent metagenome]|uniref:SnoaL-like domain-containing protein n=1 Tax=hydrothermal vent metagenome TaxID=652676 RepID=A0A3B0U0P0_9ZZZZ
MPSPTEVVQTMYAAYGAGNMDALKDTLSENIKWIYHGPDAIKHADTYSGKAGVMKFFDNVNEHVEYLDFQPNQFIAQGNMVIVLGNEKQKILKNGEILEQGWVQIYTVNSDLIDKMEEFSDTAHAEKVHIK